MKEKYTSPSYQWYPDRFAGSPRVKRMSLEERGAYRELLDYQWAAGCVPDDVLEIATILRVNRRRAAAIWQKVAPCFREESPGCLVNPALEEIRSFAEKRSKNGRQGGRPPNQTETESKPKRKQSESKTKANQNPPNSGLGKNKIDPSLRSGSSPRPPDEACEVFAAAYLGAREIPYEPGKGDFVQLAQLRKRLGLTKARASPDGWGAAVENYLASPMGKYSLADLCTRFDVFRKTALDRYSKPVGAGNERKDTWKHNLEVTGIADPFADNP